MLTMLDLEWSRAARSGMAQRMRAQATKAGGCFLSLSILAGFVAGLAIANPMKGVLIGTATGVILALAVWLIDRRRVG